MISKVDENFHLLLMIVAARTTSSSGFVNIDLTQSMYSLKAPKPICSLNRIKYSFSIL